MKVAIFHSPRTGSNLLCNLLHQTGVAGVADYLNCGLPLGSIGTINLAEFPDKMQTYEASQTTPNGVFACKLSWEGLIALSNQIGIEAVYQWLDTIDHHIYLYRHDTVAQAVSMFIAGKRRYFSTLKTDGIFPTPEYSYQEIAYRRMMIETHRAQMETYFEDFCIEPIRLAYEAFSYNEASMHDGVKMILKRLGLEYDKIGTLKPQIQKQVNPAKEAYKDRFLCDWADRNEK